MKKQLDTTVMENELRSGSAFFRAVPPRQNQPEKAQPSPLPAELKDIDPNAAPSLASPLDNIPAIKPPRKEANLASVVPLEEAQNLQPTTSPPFERNTEQTAVEANGQPDIHPNEPPPVRLTARTPVRRVITRYAFEFFQDQIETLREFSLDEKLRGEKGSMSEMVREGIDMYISKRRNRDEA